MPPTPLHVRVGAHTVVVMAEQLETHRTPADERPVSSTTPSLEEAIASAAAATEAAAREFLRKGTVSVTIEAGLEFAVESGKLLAVFGKASSTSSIKVIATYGQAESSNPPE